MITAKPEDVGFSSKRLNSISKFVNDYVSEGKLSGVSTMIARHGQIISSEQHGMADIATQKPIKEDTIFRIYSMTKPITSVAIMMLYEKGKFALDDPVGRFIPELSSLKVFERMSERGIRLKDQKTPITIRQLDKGYEIIAGERRWRAAKKAKLKSIPAYVLHIVSDAEMMQK